jgi:hypothetical protein
MKAPARDPWAIGQAIESWASVAFFLRAMVSSADLDPLENTIGALQPVADDAAYG